jgi:DNA-binding NarL/FixJ family response regulator
VILNSTIEGPRAVSALGYVTLTDAPEVLVDAIRAVSSGTPFVSDDAERLLRAETPAMLVPLTEKQRRLLTLYVYGMALRAAAAVIGIAQGTACSASEPGRR